MTRSRASAKQAGTRWESAIVDYLVSRGWRHAERRAKTAPTGRPLKGDHLSFAGVHKRLMRLWGPASSRQCVDCEGRAAEWSYDGLDPKQLTGESNGFVLAYSLDLSHYQPRCTSCHRKFDGAGDRPRDALGRFTSERAA